MPTGFHHAKREILNKIEMTKNMQKVDVVLLTKNACRKKSKEIFVKCLNRIYDTLPLYHLIVVDGYSTDETLSIIRKYDQKYHNVLLFYDNRGRGKARELGISKVDTPWFVFVDSDTILYPNWFSIVSKYINADVGAVEGEPKDFVQERVESIQYNNAMSNLRRKIRKQEQLERRGFFGNVLIRTECVKDIQIPKVLHAGEDIYIKKWIIKKGFRWVITDEKVADHHRDHQFIDSKIRLLEQGAYSRTLNYTTCNNLFYGFLISFPKGLYASIKFKNIRILVFSVSKRFYLLKGWLRWEKFLPYLDANFKKQF